MGSYGSQQQCTEFLRSGGSNESASRHGHQDQDGQGLAPATCRPQGWF